MVLAASRQEPAGSGVPYLTVAPAQDGAARAEEELQPQVLTQNGVGHQLRVFEVLDASNQVQGNLVSCQLCGSYSHICRRLLSKRCLGGTSEHSIALRAQLKRLEQGRHPQGRKPYTQWTVRPLPEEASRNAITTAVTELASSGTA
eukprot:5322950-Amphidinium_carterae.1